MSHTVKLPDELVSSAKEWGLRSNRSASEQIEYWVRIGKAAEENPDLPTSFLIDLLHSKEEIAQGIYSEYEFGEPSLNLK